MDSVEIHILRHEQREGTNVSEKRGTLRGDPPMLSLLVRRSKGLTLVTFDKESEQIFVFFFHSE